MKPILSPCFQNVLLASCALLLVVLLGEISLQGYYRYREGLWLWENDAFKVTSVMPVKDRRQYTLRPGFHDETLGIIINDKGFRAPTSWPSPQPNERVIVALGDSVPFGAGVRDTETYPYQLEQLFHAGGSGIRVLNAGVPSYTLRQSIDRLEQEILPRYKPVVITLQTANDISLLTYYREQWTPDSTWARVGVLKRLAPLPALQKSALVHYLVKALAAKNQSEVALSGRTHQAYPADKLVTHTRAELDRLIALCQKHQMALVLLPANPFYYQTANTEKNPALSQWRTFQPVIPLWDPLIRAFNRTLQQAAEPQHQVFFLDLRVPMDRQNRAALYVDFIHHTPAGNRLVAEQVYQAIRAQYLLSAHASSTPQHPTSHPVR